MSEYGQYIQGASKRTGIMEFCIFCIIKGGYSIKITVSNTYIIKSIQLAIIQAFTAPWKIKFEEKVVILNFLQKMHKNDYIHHVFIKTIGKSWLANVQYTQLVFQKAIQVWRSKILLIFAIYHDF
jgi:hypothetical protein